MSDRFIILSFIETKHQLVKIQNVIWKTNCIPFDMKLKILRSCDIKCMLFALYRVWTFKGRMDQRYIRIVCLPWELLLRWDSLHLRQVDQRPCNQELSWSSLHPVKRHRCYKLLKKFLGIGKNSYDKWHE